MTAKKEDEKKEVVKGAPKEVQDAWHKLKQSVQVSYFCGKASAKIIDDYITGNKP